MERRADPHGQAAPGSLRHLKGLLGRPIGLQRRDGQLHVVLVERRRSPRPSAKLPLQQIRDELRDGLLAHRLDDAARVMRHLVVVHDELGRRGWAGVQGLPAQLLQRATVQAEMLAGDAPSPGLSELVDRLRLLRAAAELREERASRPAEATGAAALEVSETTHEAFDAAERGWVDTVSPVLNDNAPGAAAEPPKD